VSVRDKYLAIITARSGSKRLPGKNVREICGKPLFVWSVLAGLNCPQVGRTIVSTDSAEYQRIAIDAGADCPWLRDLALASDETSSAEVVEEVLDRLGEEVKQYRALVLLQPTSPLRTSADISGALALYEAHNAPAVVSVSEAECPPVWMGQLPANMVMDEFVPTEFRGLRSQDLGNWYRINGAIYVIGVDEFRRENGFKPEGTLAYVMPRERSIDVDTGYDFELAEILMTRNLKK
jgi:CMP-N,N'-diacetyllegionaminic acid synthase